MKISFLSAFPPYRGGISKHSSLIYHHLSSRHKVQALNFSKLYPSIFFPGKTQYDKKSDYIGERVLNSMNFFSWKKTAKSIKAYNPDIFIFKFWHPFFAPCYTHLIRSIKKNNDCKIIMICDNIFPHERFPLSKILIKRLINKVDGFLVQSSIVENELKSLVGSPIYSKNFHPIYDNYPKGIDMLEARNILDISESKVVLFFGLVRKYKGLDILIKSMDRVFEKDSDIKLIIAGECYGDKDKYLNLINNSKFKSNICWVEKFISDSEVPIFFSASDVVVLPYRTASQSGVIPLAYNYNKPVITSNLVSLTEVIEEGRTGHTFDLESELEVKILDFFNSYDSHPYEENIRKYKKIFSWDSFINGIEDVYSRLNERN